MEARCAVCQDTGSRSQDIDGHQDCTACDAVERRAEVLGYLRELSPYITVGAKAWAAYLFAQRQAAPVAQPAQQVEAVGQDWKDRLYAALDAEFDLRGSDKRDSDGQRMGLRDDDTQIGAEFAMAWFEKHMLAASQLEAQQAGDVAHLPDMENWNVQMACVKALLSITEGELECIGEKLLDTYIDEVKRVVAAAIAQGRKA